MGKLYPESGVELNPFVSKLYDKLNLSKLILKRLKSGKKHIFAFYKKRINEPLL